jgi:NAD(P)H-dependent FMN reductase
MSFKTLVFYGSYRSDRQGLKAVKFMINQLKLRNHEVVFADAMHYDFGILNRMYKEYKKDQAPQKMEELATHIRTADGFVVVGGEYNHSIQPGLSNLMDHYLEEYYLKKQVISWMSWSGTKRLCNVKEKRRARHSKHDELNSDHLQHKPMENTVFNQVFRDSEGKIVLAQMPNLPLTVWFVASLLKVIFTTDRINVGLDVLAFGSLFTWAWEELFQGVNYFRRALGLIVLVGLIASKIQ